MTLKSLNFTLLVVHLQDESLSTLAEELNKKRLMAPDFFAQTPIVVNIDDESLCIDFLQLQQTVEDNGFFLSGITGNVSENQKQQAGLHSIPVLHSSRKTVLKTTQAKENAVVSNAANIEEMVKANLQVDTINQVKTKVHVGRVRSGQQIYAKESDLVISGDVGAGAEVIADGNIHIYGTLRGKALAGAMGNTNAAIFCQLLQPELVSIAGVYKLSEALPEHVWGRACSIFLKDQNLLFANLNRI